MIHLAQGFLDWTALAIEKIIRLFCYFFRGHCFHFFPHDLSYPWGNRFEDVFFQDMIYLDFFDIVLQLKQELGWFEVMSGNVSHQFLRLLSHGWAIL